MKVSKYPVLTLACFFLILSFVSGIILPFIIKPECSADTVCTDGDYYCETTYYSTERAFKEQNKEYNADGEFVGATVKNLYVYEPSDENGNVTESRPLKKEEIEKVGEDNKSLYNLSIGLIVTFDNDTGLYQVSTTSEWQSAGKSVRDKEKPERTTMDYIDLSWGGSGALAAIDEQTYGEYENGAEIHITKRESDSFAGFVWQFEENVKRKSMRFVQTNIHLKNLYEYQGKETDIKMTYTHTYSEFKGSFSFVDDIGRISPKIVFKEYESSWLIGIEVHGIAY